MPDRLTAEQRKKCMSNIHSKDTGIEVKLRNALWHRGYRYRKNYNKIPGKPDIALTKYKIAVFCDSEFFHGKDWDESLHAQILRGSNPEFWEKKILRNMERDRGVNQQLEDIGWVVLRFWGKDIKKDWESMGETRERWQVLGFENGVLGMPIAEVRESRTTPGMYYQQYENGYIVGTEKTGYMHIIDE